MKKLKSQTLMMLFFVSTTAIAAADTCQFEYSGGANVTPIAKCTKILNGHFNKKAKRDVVQMDICVGKNLFGEYVLDAILKKAKYPPNQVIENLGYPYSFTGYKNVDYADTVENQNSIEFYYRDTLLFMGTTKQSARLDFTDHKHAILKYELRRKEWNFDLRYKVLTSVEILCDFI